MVTTQSSDCCTSLLYSTTKATFRAGRVAFVVLFSLVRRGALGGTRTPNLLIRSEIRAGPRPAVTSDDLGGGLVLVVVWGCCAAIMRPREPGGDALSRPL
jgi:hypothetical protein